MKYQNSVFVNNFIKKLIWWYIFLVFICLAYYLYFKLSPNVVTILKIDLKNVLGVFYNIDDFKKISILMFGYQIFLTLYTFISFSEYEKYNSPEFVFNRLNKYKLLNQKLIIVVYMIVFIRTIYFLINFVLYSKHINITFIDYFISISFHLIVIFIYYFYKFCNLKKQ